MHSPQTTPAATNLFTAIMWFPSDAQRPGSAAGRYELDAGTLSLTGPLQPVVRRQELFMPGAKYLQKFVAV